MSLLDNAIDDVAEGFLKGAAEKAASGFVAKGYITADQEAVVVQGFMDEVQIALEMYQATQKQAPA